MRNKLVYLSYTPTFPTKYNLQELVHNELSVAPPSAI